MKKNGFTLMELLVSIFITGMVMLSLVAMWKTSSNNTSQAQRQAVIKNENTIFLRKFYSDFISTSEVICPWGYENAFTGCDGSLYISLHNARLVSDDSGNLFVDRTTGPVCSGNFQNTVNLSNVSAKCVRPSYTAYILNDDVANSRNGIYRCNSTDTFLSNDSRISLDALMTEVKSRCEVEGNRELILPYVTQFDLTVPVVNGRSHGESLLVEYTIMKNFSMEVPPIVLKFRRYFIKHKGV